MGDNQYVTLSKYIGDKTQMNHELEKLRSEQEETLHLLASQLKEKFSEMEQGIAKQTVNESYRSDVDDLLTKYRQLEQNNTDLRTNFKTIQKKYNEQQAEMMVLKNKTYLLEHKLAALEQLKTVNQLQSLVTLQKRYKLWIPPLCHYFVKKKHVIRIFWLCTTSRHSLVVN
jgi:chromosome segregation ATPase